MKWSGSKYIERKATFSDDELLPYAEKFNHLKERVHAPMWKIRKAALDDLDELIRLRFQLFRESGYLQSNDPSPELVEATRTYLINNLPTDRFIAWIAEVEGQIVGTSGLVFFEIPPVEENLSGLEAYVMNMYTLPQWRGRGIATSLLQEIFRTAKTRGAKRIRLRTTPAGQRTYEKSGFVFTTADMELVWQSLEEE